MATERFLKLSFITLIVIGFLAAFADGIARADFFHPFDPGVRGGTAGAGGPLAGLGAPEPGLFRGGQDPCSKKSTPFPERFPARTG